MTATSQSEREAAQWKKKYFDALTEQESAEKRWKETDELLRRAVSRLALAADGNDKVLDSQLKELRQALGERGTNLKLREQVDAISRRLTQLDSGHDNATRSATNPLAHLLDALSLPQALNRQAESLKKKLVTADAGEHGAAVKSFAELIHLALELSFDDVAPPAESDTRSGVFRRLFGSGAKQARVDQAGDAPVGGVLVKLLERLSLPQELTETVEEIREQILSTPQDGSWDEVLERIATLIRSIRTQTQKEKQGIEDFLSQLTERLQDVDRQLGASEQYYDDTHDAEEQLDEAVKSEMGGIGKSMEKATDLSELKAEVHARVDTVLQHLDTHRESEQQRYEQAKQQIGEMSVRLHDLEEEADELRSQLHREQNQAKIDALTGIPNRLAWEERLDEELARHRRFGTPLVLLVWDIDKFKSINDSFGHRAGDKVLRNLARAFAGGIRETDFVARYGGEEFTLLMTGSSPADCLAVADKLRAIIASTGFHFRGESVVITASCGIAGLQPDETAEQWFERADRALYRAKEQGRNRCLLAD